MVAVNSLWQGKTGVKAWNVTLDCPEYTTNAMNQEQYKSVAINWVNKKGVESLGYRDIDSLIPKICRAINNSFRYR